MLAKAGTMYYSRGLKVIPFAKCWIHCWCLLAFTWPVIIKENNGVHDSTHPTWQTQTACSNSTRRTVQNVTDAEFEGNFWEKCLKFGATHESCKRTACHKWLSHHSTSFITSYQARASQVQSRVPINRRDRSQCPAVSPQMIKRFNSARYQTSITQFESLLCMVLLVVTHC